MLPIQFRPVALLLGILLSAVVILSDSQLAVGASLVVLALALLALEAPVLAANCKDDSE